MTTTTQATIETIMTRNPVVISMGTSLAELAEVLEGNQISGVPVVDPHEQIVGVVSKTDLVSRLVEGGRAGFLPDLARAASDLEEPLGSVDDIMTGDPVTAVPTESIASVARRMASECVHRVIVIDAERRPVGVVTTLDVLGVFPG
ncbi:MAG: CBS domain-containing protein [Phycisphaerales bacterium]|nr:CBS domain-containing protein [Phycisphaerae bacterium]NNM25465.1 CBS domain-containing protein [Phycisphaerales bacterium]